MTHSIKRLLRFLFRIVTDAKAARKASVDAHAELLPEINLAFSDWHQFGGGTSLGSIGSESGIIILDLESNSGARITVEQDAVIAPYCVTFGIYGLLFHTYFCASLEHGVEYVSKTVTYIDNIFRLYEVPDSERDEFWKAKHDQAISKLTQ